jgi:hypothetical protein
LGNAAGNTTGYSTVTAAYNNAGRLKTLANGKPLVYLDSGASTQKPRAVIDRLSNRTITLPVDMKSERIGIKQQFTGGQVAEGDMARFEAIVLGADGKPIEAKGLKWEVLRLPLLILALATAWTTTSFTNAVAHAQTKPAATTTEKSAADLAFEPLQKEYDNLYHSLLNSGGVGKEDHQAIEALRDRIDHFIEKFPNDQRGLTADLYLSTWLSDGPRIDERLGACYSAVPRDSLLAAAGDRRHQSRAQVDRSNTSVVGFMIRV